MKQLCSGLLLAGLLFTSVMTQAETATPFFQSRFQSVYQKAMRGDPLAQFELASFYEKGQEGLAKNVSYALSWYEESAHNGFQQALVRLKTLGGAD